jgi:urea carboxylase-associated protein 2
VSEPLNPSPAEIERYYALKARGAGAGGRARPAQDRLTAPHVVPPERVLWRETLAPGGQVSRIIRAGQTLRLVNVSGRGTPAFIALNADLPSERLNTSDTAKVQWNAFIGKGKLIYSDMGRVLFSITEDICGYHDLIVGASAAGSVRARFADDPYRANARDNFVLALGKFGLGAREVVPCISFFTGIGVDKTGKVSWIPDVAQPGDFIDLRAEMNVLVALSNTSHPFAPGDAESPPLEVMVWQNDPPGVDDPCRTASEEAVRAFINTRDFLMQRGLA